MEDLPTEVIAEVLQVGFNLLRPEKDLWLIEVGVVGFHGTFTLGEVVGGERSE